MGSMVNSVTSPMGLKLFKGGPYADAGKLDQAGQQAQQYQQQLAPLIAQIAQMAGVGNPLTGQPGQFANDPYGLSPLQQGAVNQQAGIDRQAYDQIMGRVKANLTAKGMGDSSTMAAAEAYLGQQLQGQLGSERVQAGENAYQNRNQAMQMIGNLLGQGFGAQQQVTGQQAQLAQETHSNAMQQLGSLLALGMYAGGVGPFGRAKPTPAGVPAGVGEGAGMPAGYNPTQGTGPVPNIYRAMSQIGGF